MSEDNAMKMTGEIKRALLLKDIPLDKGFRGAPVGRVARVNTSRKDSGGESQESGDEGDPDKERQDCSRSRASFEEERDVNFIQSRRTNLSERRVTTSRGQEAVSMAAANQVISLEIVRSVDTVMVNGLQTEEIVTQVGGTKADITEERDTGG